MSTFMSGLRGKLLGVSGGLLLLMVAGVSRANSVTYVYTDPQGTPLAEADVNGNITATFDYAPYGSIALGTAPNGPGYTGHVNDPDTQLVYMQARYYDPAVGRFLSVDPVGPAAGNPYNFNRFAYANNNPIVNLDPDGRCTGSLISDSGGGCSGGGSIAGPGYTTFVNPSPSEGGKEKAPKTTEVALIAGGQRINIDKMVQSMFANANGVDTYGGRCAAICHKAMTDGGIGWDKDRPSAAGQNGPWLVEHGAAPVAHSDTNAMPDGYGPRKGDIAVFSGGASHPIGHMEIYDGKDWVSDTKQTTFSPGRSYPGSVTVYRFPQQ